MHLHWLVANDSFRLTPQSATYSSHYIPHQGCCSTVDNPLNYCHRPSPTVLVSLVSERMNIDSPSSWLHNIYFKTYNIANRHGPIPELPHQLFRQLIHGSQWVSLYYILQLNLTCLRHCLRLILWIKKCTFLITTHVEIYTQDTS